jgi:hypothetical protein
MVKVTKQENLTAAVDFSQLVPAEEISGDGKKDTRLLQEMYKEACEYLLSFNWCKSIRRAWFGQGVDGIYVVFLFEIVPSSKKVDKALWVIVGDIPSAYLVIDESPTPLAALRNYLELMQEWVDIVKAGKSVDGCIPVHAPAKLEYANLLQRRIDFIGKGFLK